jgi:2-iminobutanoate/2-iminopropanoate deaminase
VRIGDFQFISGQLPLDPDRHMVSGTIADKAKQALTNVGAIVEAACGTISAFVRCTVYISDVGHWAEVDKIYPAFLFGVRGLPARVVVPVKKLNHGAQIETPSNRCGE